MKFSLSLSGGGVRGAAHIGVLKALDEEGLKPSALSGTSAGAVVAALYAYGISAVQMEEWVYWLAKNGRKYIDGDLSGIARLVAQVMFRREITFSGIIKGHKLETLLAGVVGECRIEEMAQKLIIPAVDLNTGRTIIFSNSRPVMGDSRPGLQWERSGKLSQIVRASAAVPGIFQPVEWQDCNLVDGGVKNNLPVDLLAATGEKNILAVDVGCPYEKPKDRSIVEVLTHSFAIMGEALKDCTADGERLLLKPEIPEEVGLLSFECMPDCMERSYRYTKRKMPQIKRELNI